MIGREEKFLGVELGQSVIEPDVSIHEARDMDEMVRGDG